MKFTPRPYQAFTIEHIVDNPEAGLFLDMGLGKTVSTLTAIDKLMFERFEVERVLVIAPKKVSEDVWTTEVAKWDHLRHFRVSLVLGPEKRRIEALKAKADIYVINRENVAWLTAYYGHELPFDMIVIDELSSFKSPKSERFKALRRVRPSVRRVVGLTGTPSPNGLQDLWSQIYLLDQGKRLGPTVGGYRANYFVPNQRNGHVVFNYKLRESSLEQAIYDKISDICISMKAKDHLDLPERIDNTRLIHFPPELHKKYLAFERDQVLSLIDSEITALNAAALTNKLLQFANGAVYDDTKAWHEVHNEKIEVLREDIEAANGQPVLLFYSYRHDLERIKTKLKEFEPRVLETSRDIQDWNAGKIQLLLAHPASAGHGLNLQDGGHLVEWFQLPWSLELYQQAVARLDRQGQTQTVVNNRLVMAGTMDEDVLAALERKADGQEALMQAVKARIDKYKKS